MFWAYVSMTLLMLSGLFMIFIILLQRGRGGGLAGAFGGLGGQSAFGTKAGDVFTKITVVIAVIWVLLASIGGFALRAGGKKFVKEEINKPEVNALDAPTSLPTGTNTGTGFPFQTDSVDADPAAENPAASEAGTTPESVQPGEDDAKKSETSE